MTSKLIVFIIFLLSFNSQAVTIATSLPEFGNLAKKLLPEAEIIYLLNGTEDAHHVDANPRMIFSLAKADIVLMNGLQFEMAWLPKAINLSGNSKIQLGQKGHCDLSKNIQVLGLRKNVDRSMGDVHAQGNPHYTLDLRAMVQVVNNIKTCLEINNQKINKDNLVNIRNSFDTLIKKLKKNKYSGLYYSFHTEFLYLGHFLGLDIKRTLERIPGVLPSATYLAEIADLALKEKPKKVIANLTASDKTLKKFTELSGIQYTKFAIHPKPEEDFISFYEKLIKSILQ